MKYFRGTQKVASFYNKIDLLVDFEDLFKYKGNKKLLNRLQKTVGVICFSVGLSLSFVALYNLNQGGNVFSLKDFILVTQFEYVLIWISVYFFIYFAFLFRDTDEFDFNFENTNLQTEIKKINESKSLKSIELDNFFSLEARIILDEAYYKANTDFLYHVSLDLLDERKLKKILERRMGIDLKKFQSLIVAELKGRPFDKEYQLFFLRCFSVGIDMNATYIGLDVLFVVMAKFYWLNSLKDLGISMDEINSLGAWIKNNIKENQYKRKWRSLRLLKPTGPINLAFTSRATPTLDELGIDYTSLAARREFSISIGKEELMTKVLESLQRESGSAVLILGEPGVGKTHFLKYLATRMVVEDVPDKLKDLRLVVVDLTRAMARSGSIDEFKAKLQSLLDEVVKSKNIILVFEEVGQIFQMRGEGRAEVINMIGNMVSEMKLKVIATSNSEEYTKQITEMKGFASLFEVHELREPDFNLAFQIVMDYVDDFEKNYGLEIRTESVKQILRFAPKIQYEKVLPDKGIDLLEEAVLRAKSLRLNFVAQDTVDKLLKEKVGVNVGRITTEESGLLQNIEVEMHKKVVGQDNAIRSIASALRRSRSGLVTEKRPVASFLFYGPTGVGKTEIAKALASVYYGDEKLMIRLNMSEFHEENNLDRLIGYLSDDGSFVEGVLTEQVKRKPFSLILLDELEKANPKILDLFLQVLDDGYLNDGSGKKIDFTNSIIIATSNAGSKDIAELLSQGKNYKEIESIVKPKLYDVYRVEFLNRFDKVIMFTSLTRVEVESIAVILLKNLNKRLEEKGILIKWDKRTLEELVEFGYNKIFGARELRRVIQDNIEDELAKYIIDGRVKSGSVVEFSGLKIVKVE